MSLLRKFAGQTVIYGFGYISSKLANYLLAVILLTYLLGEKTEGFGVYDYMYAYAGVFITLFSFRFDSALFRFGNKNENLDDALSNALLFVSVSASALVVLGVFFNTAISDFVGYPCQPKYVRWFAFILAFDVVNVIPFAKLRLENKAKKFALLRILNVVLSSLLIVFFLVIYPRLGATFLPVQDSIVNWVFISNLIASGLLFLALLPELRGTKIKMDSLLFQKMIRYAYPLVIVGAAGIFVQAFSTPLQEYFLPGTDKENMAQAGIYSSTRRIAAFFLMFITAFNYAAEPFFFNNSSKEDREKYYGKICRLFTLIGGAVILMMYYGVDLLKYILESNFWSSLPLLPILLMSYLLLGIYYNIAIWYKLADMTLYGALISILGAFITLGISAAFLPTIGYAASAWASLASYIFMVGLGYFIGQNKYPISYPMGKIILDLLLIASLLIVGLLIRTHASIPLKYASYLLILCLFFYYVYYSEKEEWRKIFRWTK